MTLHNFFLAINSQGASDLAKESTTSISQAFSEGAEQVSQAFSEGASQAVDGAKEAIKDNKFLSYLKQMLDVFTPDKFMSFLAKIGVAAVVILMGVIVSKILVKIITNAMKKRGTDTSVYIFIQTVIRFLVYTITAISALSSLGLNISSLVAALASIGVAVGLGLQSSVSQLVSGIIIIFNRPFKNGDYIEVNGIAGVVSEIRIMNTILHTVDNKRVIVPNSDITSNSIINFTGEETRRCDIQFGIGYDDDISKAREVIFEVVKKNKLVLANPKAEVFVVSHEASCVQLELRCWAKSTDYWPVYFSLQEEVKLAFDANNISIPFNQMDIHIVNK